MARLILFLLVAPLFAEAQLLEVKQTIYGMDCAPCARGVEASLKRLDGVQAVTISLNNGTAEIRLAPDNRQRLGEIRQRISDNGFSAKEAQVKLSGVLREKEGKLIIEVESGEVYALQQFADAKNVLEQLRKSKAGKHITVAGVVAEAKSTPDAPWNIQVTQLFD